MGNYTDEQAGNMRGLVKLMRRNLELTEQLCVTMAEELDFVNTFINLEREALGDSFILSTSIDAAIHLDQEILPSMMIQIPIENAIKHALKDKEGMKRLWIDIKKTGEESASRCVTMGRLPDKQCQPWYRHRYKSDSSNHTVVERQQ